MATLVKTYHFATTTEGWTAHPDNGSISMAWYPPHKARNTTLNKKGHQNNPLLSTMGGCLKTTGKQGAARSSNYWELSTTWEALGVPVGATINSVQGDSIWRIDLKQRKVSRWSAPTFNDTDVLVGQFQLCDSGGTLIDVFHSGGYAPENPPLFPDPRWYGYPAGVNTHAVAYKPASWLDQTGISVAPTGSSSSGSTVKFRLWVELPQIAAGLEKWIRVKQDYVVLTINYTPLVGGGGNWFFSN